MSPIVGMVGFLLLAVLMLRPMFLAGAWKNQEFKRQRRETQVLSSRLQAPSRAEEDSTASDDRS